MGHGDHSVSQNLRALGWKGLGTKDSMIGLKCEGGAFLGSWITVEGGGDCFY